MVFVRQHELGDDVVIGLAGEMIPEPGVVMLPERKIRLRGIDDLGAGIDLCLDRIGLDQRLGEAMDRAADKLVERLSRLLEICPLFGGNAFGKGDLQIRGDFALGEFVDEASDADQQFAGGELGEGDGGDAFGLDAPGEAAWRRGQP